MKQILKNIFQYLTDRKTWKRVYYFSRVKDPEEALSPLTKKDIIPILLTFFLIFLFVYLVVLVVVASDKIFNFARH